MSSGLALTQFTDFVDSTGPLYLNSVDSLINHAQKQDWLLSWFMRRDGKDMVQGGQTINEIVQFDSGGTFEHYKPNAEFTYRNPQTLDTITLPWRFSKAEYTWLDHEIMQQANSMMTKEARAMIYLKIKKAKEQAAWTDVFNGMEDSIWANAINQQAEMEANTGSTPMSLPALISEDATNHHTTGWTTIETIDPASEDRWRNQISTYDYDNPSDTDGDRDGLFDALDEMYLKLRWRAPVMSQEHFTPSQMTSRNQVICASRGGINLYKRLLRDSNDTLVSKQDSAYNDPKYSGVQMLYVPTLDTATIFVDGSTGDTELNATTDGYRYWCLNSDYIKPIFHTERYMHLHPSFTLEKQPYTHVKLFDIWWNIFCSSRQRLGIIAPQ